MTHERKHPNCGQAWNSPDHGRLVCDRSENHRWKSGQHNQHRSGNVRFVQSNSGRFRYYDPSIDSKQAKAARKPEQSQGSESYVESDHYTEADYDTWMKL